jgi:hypothetical protein
VFIVEKNAVGREENMNQCGRVIKPVRREDLLELFGGGHDGLTRVSQMQQASFIAMPPQVRVA